MQPGKRAGQLDPVVWPAFPAALVDPVVLPAFPVALVVRWKNAFPQWGSRVLDFAQHGEFW